MAKPRDTHNKRTPLQRQMDRVKIAEVLYQKPHLTDEQLALEMAKETGLQLSRQQIQSDRSKMLADHAKREESAIEGYRQKALEKLDEIEAMAIEGWQRSLSPIEQSKARHLATRRKAGGKGDFSEEDSKLYLAELEQFTTQGIGDPRFLGIMLDTAKERNKLNQLYAQKPPDVTNNYTLVKAVVGIDPKKHWGEPQKVGQIVDNDD